jgi:hypothetical protein
MRRKISAVVVLCLLASVGIMAVAPAALAKVVVGQSIAGIKLGDTEAQVKRLVGKPSSCDPCGKPEIVWRYEKGFEGDLGFSHQGRVQNMWTASNQQRTSTGIHTIGLNGKGHGSSVAEIKQAYPNAKCEELPNSQGYTTCDIVSSYHGRKVKTSFEVIATFSGLAEISIGFV